MTIERLKDELFDLLNEDSGLDIADIELDDANNIIIVTSTDGNAFEIECRQIS